MRELAKNLKDSHTEEKKTSFFFIEKIKTIRMENIGVLIAINMQEIQEDICVIHISFLMIN